MGQGWWLAREPGRKKNTALASCGTALAYLFSVRDFSCRGRVRKYSLILLSSDRSQITLHSEEIASAVIWAARLPAALSGDGTRAGGRILLLRLLRA
ncbi:hypothetical protein H696_05804 [Fonticula alba]|uniref:Folliculin/SMCR8 longin domain-containing protein n=1 Tax=Fonticula alba TaxID=691883 RepID=A0A058Z0B3_FONAL|nr:hypothetical protein H696_05804 [Fonticula alba]KCV67695.1 hypothetical protein H696_05804 [Fonticula alba]|eukprot:XP_009497879.1 hypothetical protein H696_05804 [Fonticula alba]